MGAVHTGLYVVMGVAGSGKTTIGAKLARALDIAFVEGDDLHPAENVRRMAAGIPLTDDDRRPWLLAIAARHLLRSEAQADVQVVYLKGSPELIAERMAQRRGHFMPPALLESQFATLEEPAPDEHAWVCDIRQPPDAIVAALVQRAA